MCGYAKFNASTGAEANLNCKVFKSLKDVQPPSFPAATQTCNEDGFYPHSVYFRQYWRLNKGTERVKLN